MLQHLSFPTLPCRALLAISGGLDSVVLLHLLVAAGWRDLVLCHVNHGLRGRESGQDAAFVRRLAQHYGLLCEVTRVDVATRAVRERVSTEMAGRSARYEFLHSMAVKHGAEVIFLAHHADDQAETILANVCRGTGIGGLKGMVKETAGLPRLCRPLLEVRRAEISDYASRHSLTFREDGSNRSLEYRRNRLRHEVLPLLDAVYERSVTPLIVRLGKQAARDEAFLEKLALDFFRSDEAMDAQGRLYLSPALRALDEAVLSRVIYFWLGESKVSSVDYDLVEGVLAMLRPGGTAKINLPAGWFVRRKAKMLWVEK